MPPVLRVADGKCLFDAEIADDGDRLLGPHGSPDGRDPRGVIGVNGGEFGKARVAGSLLA